MKAKQEMILKFYYVTMGVVSKKLNYIIVS